MASSSASALRAEQRRLERALSPLERLRLAQRLGDEAAARYARAHGVSVGIAAREFALRRQRGRRPSACLTLP